MPRDPVVAQHRFSLPHQRREFAMTLFLASLAMFFAAGAIGYVIFRSTSMPRTTVSVVQIPPSMWISTLLLLFSSVSLHLSLRYVRRERRELFRRWLLAALLSGTLFCLAQVTALSTLILWHSETLTKAAGPYGLVFSLVLIHAAHVLGGLVALLAVAWQALNGRYDHEYHSGVRLASRYWWFLDGVWMAMLFTFIVVG